MPEAVGFGEGGIQKSQSAEGFSFIPKSSKKKSDAAKLELDKTIQNLGFKAPSVRKKKAFLGGACVAIGITSAAIGATIGVVGTLAGIVISNNPLNGGPLIGIPVVTASIIVGGQFIAIGVAATWHGIDLIREANLPKAISRKLFKGEELKQVKKKLGVKRTMTSIKKLPPEIAAKLNTKRAENKEKTIKQFLNENPLVKNFLNGKEPPKKRDDIQQVNRLGVLNVFKTHMQLQVDVMFEEKPPPTIDEAVARLAFWFNSNYRY